MSTDAKRRHERGAGLRPLHWPLTVSRRETIASLLFTLAISSAVLPFATTSVASAPPASSAFAVATYPPRAARPSAVHPSAPTPFGICRWIRTSLRVLMISQPPNPLLPQRAAA